MKRARVWKALDGEPNPWIVYTGADSHWNSSRYLPSYTEALAHALAEVGLTPTNPKEQS